MYPFHFPGKILPGAARASLLALTLTGAAQAAVDTTPAWKLSGFGTLGAARSSERHADYSSSAMKASGAGRSHEWSPQVDSRLGAQADLRVGPRWSAVLQVVSEQRMDSSYRPRVEWANLKYQASPELALRFGRIALPLFIAADYRKVGYAYPWVRPPVEVYGAVPLSNSDGADLSWRWNGENLRSTTQAFVGRTDIPLYDGARLRGSGSAGLSHTIERGDLSVRATFLTARLTVSLYPQLFAGLRAFGEQGEALASAVATERKRASAASIGMNYDPGRWFVLAEAGHYSVDSFLGTTNSVYASTGYRHGALTPYLGYARIRGKKPDGPHALALDGLPAPLAAAGASLNEGVAALLRTIASQSTVSAGLRWDLASNVALKLQYDHVTPRAGSRGTMMNLGPDFRSGQTAHVTSAALDFVF
jgi:opacity protein-like surface antigen